MGGDLLSADVYLVLAKIPCRILYIHLCTVMSYALSDFFFASKCLKRASQSSSKSPHFEKRNYISTRCYSKLLLALAIS